MPIGRPTTIEDEDLTDELRARLYDIQEESSKDGSKTQGLLFQLLPFDKADNRKAESLPMPMTWTQSLEQAAFDLKRMGLSCLIVDDMFKASITFMNAKFKGKKIAIATLRPSEKIQSDDPLKTANQPRRLVLRYVDHGDMAVAESESEAGAV